jgi:hypothetical protein
MLSKGKPKKSEKKTAPATFCPLRMSRDNVLVGSDAFWDETLTADKREV